MKDRKEFSVEGPGAFPFDMRFNTMRVAHKMAEGQIGRWRLRHFTQTAEKEAMDQLKISLSEPPERQAMALRRVIPPGTYISLQRRMIEQEVIDHAESEIDTDKLAAQLRITREEVIESVLPPEHRWIPIMSDTPDELDGHEPALEFHGNVLVTGLGLGCVVSGLLANPEVTRIDVIEIDPDVIALTGHYYDLSLGDEGDERVHIWHGSALDTTLPPPDVSWDFAWHDIWTHISERNLSAETAEHGISYDRMFGVWDSRVKEQHAWALDDALEMRRVNEEIRQRNIAWFQEVESADIDRQVELLQNKVIWERHPEFASYDDDRIRQAFDPDGSFAVHLRQRLLNEPEFLEGMREIAAKDLNDPTPLGRPNEEASV